jgi:small-conductance mechanosensitive channel
VQLLRFGADGLEFRLVFWIADPQNGSGNVVSEVNIRVLQGLRAANIEIPYPQRVVHVASLPASAETETRRLG